MSLMRDVFPVNFDTQGMSPGLAARQATKLMFDLGQLGEGDRAIVTNGDSMEQRGATNTIRLMVVAPGGVVEGMGEI